MVDGYGECWSQGRADRQGYSSASAKVSKGFEARIQKVCTYFKLLLVTSPSPVPKKPDRAIHKFVCSFVSCLEYCPHSILFNHLEKILNIFGSFFVAILHENKTKRRNCLHTLSSFFHQICGFFSTLCCYLLRKITTRFPKHFEEKQCMCLIIWRKEKMKFGKGQSGGF